MLKFIFHALIVFIILSCASKDKAIRVGIPIAVVNLKISGAATIDSLTKRMGKFASKAHKKGAKVVLFPELPTLDLLPVNPADEEVKNELMSMARTQKDYESALIEIAKKYQIMIIGANHYILSGKSKFKNRAYIVKANGEIAFQDKIYPTPWEVRQGVKGNKKIEIFKTEELSFVVLTCHDAEFPDISVRLSKMKPEVIFVPSMTDDLNGLSRVKRTSQARAIEHMSYVLMTGASSEVGAKWHTYQGKSFLFTPHNKYFEEPQEGDLDEQLKIFYLDLPSLRKARGDRKQVYPARDYLNQ
ncbi:MAG: hypothetical protein CME65_03100 [Halobacteriovoraceae bacterium]|nr:hypothetical protein [Halobacteriovoraceae bacterium]|tara:strand:+ start:5205 stop:6107 length:903 start_codon:yes stop_codon:yes gene_type:complete